MPVYDFICKKCNKELKDEFVHSWEEAPSCCNRQMERLFPVPTIRFKHERIGGIIFPIDGVTIDHAEANPVHFNSYKELKEYEKKNNVMIGA